MEITEEALTLLKDLIIQEIKKDFEEKHLSKNLVNTITWEKNEEGFNIIIPAEIYNMYKFFKEGVVISKGIGSYASHLDEVGSEFMVYPKKGKRFLSTPHNHIGYVERAINSALQQWLDLKPEYERVFK